MSKKQFDEAIIQYKNGDNAAKERIILGNLKLILSVLKRINVPYHVDVNDLFQVGCIGLIKAIENFDTSLNLFFSTYAIPMINGEVKRYIRDNTPIKVSRQIKDNAYHILREKEEFIHKYNKEPSIEQLAEIVNISEKDTIQAINSINNVISLFDPVYCENGESINVIDQIADDPKYNERMVNYVTLHDSIRKLNRLQKLIVSKRYYEGMTQFEIAEELNISQAQVSRIEKKAIEELKKNF